MWFLTGLCATCTMEHLSLFIIGLLVLIFQHRIFGVIDLYFRKMPEQTTVCSKIVKWSIIHPLTFYLSWIQWLSHILLNMSPVPRCLRFLCCFLSSLKALWNLTKVKSQATVDVEAFCWNHITKDWSYVNISVFEECQILNYVHCKPLTFYVTWVWTEPLVCIWTR